VTSHRSSPNPARAPRRHSYASRVHFTPDFTFPAHSPTRAPNRPSEELHSPDPTSLPTSLPTQRSAQGQTVRTSPTPLVDDSDYRGRRAPGSRHRLPGWWARGGGATAAPPARSGHRPIPATVERPEGGQHHPRPHARPGRASKRRADELEDPPQDPLQPQPRNNPRQGHPNADHRRLNRLARLSDAFRGQRPAQQAVALRRPGNVAGRRIPACAVSVPSRLDDRACARVGLAEVSEQRRDVLRAARIACNDLQPVGASSSRR
jgi:hypothetical protein